MPLIDSEKQWVAKHAAAISSSTFPVDLAPHLPPLVEEFRDVHPHSPALDLEIQAATVATVYGPRSAGLVPDEVIDELMGEGVYTAKQLCDWAIARGCLRPYGEPRDWAHCWLPAWETLFTMIRSLIQGAVAWFGDRIGELTRGRRWKFKEASACAALIRGYLVRGCECHERDIDFHVERGIDRCATDHALGTFDPSERSLRDFLWRAAILGELRLADEVRGERAMTNSARKGILSRIIFVKESQLAAGPVLKCKMRECRTDIDLNDKCTNGHPIIPIEDITWWFWKKGERGGWFCRRCNGCNGLYFQHTGVCPYCGGNDWSEGLTFVWVRIFERPVDQNDPELQIWNMFRQLGQDGLDELLATLPVDARAVADVFFDDQARPEQIRDNLDPSPTDDEWRRIWQQIAYVCRGIVHNGISAWRARRETIAQLASPDREVGELVFLRGFRDAEALEILNSPDKKEFRRCKRRVEKILRDRALLDE